MIRAIIFDLDGTLVQTEKLKALSYGERLAFFDVGTSGGVWGLLEGCSMNWLFHHEQSFSA